MRPIGAWSLAFVSSLAIAGCGAKTGLLIPDASMDAAVPDSPDSPDAPDAPDAPMCMPGRFPLSPDSAELMLVLEGIDLVGATRRARWLPRLDPNARPGLAP